jgi:MscS family membrane protein
MRSVCLRAATAGLIIALPLCIVLAAMAADNHQLRPPDTSSPRATLQGFIERADDVYRRLAVMLEAYGKSERLFPTPEERREQFEALGEALTLAQFLDLSHIAPVLRNTITPERILQLKEVLDRIDVPATADIPDQQMMARLGSKRWRLPDTEIDLALVENGPRAGQFLVSAETIDRLPEFYERVKDLPYKKATPAAQLNEAYRMISLGRSTTLFDAYVSSPIGLSYIIPPRWMLSLPGWARSRVADVTVWQWLGLSLGALIGGLMIYGSHHMAHRRGGDSRSAPSPSWRTLALPVAIIFVAGVLVPFFSVLLRVGSSPRVVIAYLQNGIVYLAAAWLAIVVSVVIGEAIAGSERLATRSLDNQLIRLGARLAGLVVAVVILIRGGDELGLPAYSMLAGLGVGGIAVALAAQSTIANLIGSLVITIEKPFRVGHVVRIGTSEGTVEDVGFRSTRIRTLDNSLVTIPSSAVVSSTVENLSLRTKRRQRFVVQITYDTPRDKVEELVTRIRQLIVDHPLVEDSTCQVRFNNFAESSLDILVIFHLQVEDYTSELREREGLLLNIMDVVKEAGAEFAFPTRTLELVNLPASPSAALAPEYHSAATAGRETTKPATTLREPSVVRNPSD